MSSSTNRLRCRTWARPGSSLWSDSANSFATSSSAPGLMRATMQPRLTLRSAIFVSRLLLETLLDHAHLFLGVLVHVALGRLVVGGRVGLHREVLHPPHRGATVGLLEVPLDVHELERSGFDPARLRAVRRRLRDPLGDPAPHLAVVLGIRVRGEPEANGVALLFEHLGLRVLAEQAGPALDVHHSLPDEIERSFDRHGVVAVRCHVPTLPPRAYGCRTRWT